MRILLAARGRTHGVSKLAVAFAVAFALLVASGSAAGSIDAKPAPVNKELPTISGTTAQGQTLTASPGSWAGNPTAYAYQWQGCDTSGNNCGSISSATSATYGLTAAEVGKTIRVVVTASNPGGTGTATSAQTAVVTAASAPPPPPPPPAPPANTALPTVSGSAVQGQTLAGANGSWSGSPTGYAYQWRSCDATGASCAGVTGATAATYVLASGDVGKTLRLAVTAKNANGSATAVSSPTAVVTSSAPPPPPPSSGCTIFVSPSGGGDGGTASAPTTMSGAYQKMVPGSVVCLMAGTYAMTTPLFMSKGGTSSAWVTWRPYGNGTPVVKASFTSSSAVFGFQGSANYIEFDGVTIDGQNNPNVGAAFHTFQGTHHQKFVGNTILNMSSAGIMTTSSDYFTAVGNKIWHFGAGVGYSSGISVNNGNGAYWADTAGGFHNVIADNVIAGGVDNSSNHSEGNGVILDLGGNIPPTLIANNVIYMNGGRGITTFTVTGKVYVVNNTLYDDGLDTRMNGVAELTANQSSNEVWANNVASAWTPRYTYQLFSGATVGFTYDDQYGGQGTQYIASAVTSDPSQVRTAAPHFVAPPSVDPSAGGQWQNAPSPSSLGSGLALQAGSPLVDSAKDPRTLPGLDSALLAGINQYVMHAIDGTARPQGAGFDFGAYER